MYKNFYNDVSYTLSGEDGTNYIYVWFKDISDNLTDVASDSIILDTTAPSIDITSHESNSVYITTKNVLDLSGIASDNTSGLKEITWSNDRGENDNVSGTNDWTITINLYSGYNVITLIAFDNAGNSGNDTITVFYNKSKIFGYVANKNNNPIGYVKLVLTGKENKKTFITASDEDGDFEFEDLDAGAYVIKAIKKGYKRYKQTISLEEGEEKEIEIVMKKTVKRNAMEYKH